MASDSSTRRWRRWYSTLLRLYPKPFRERFGDGMGQVFTDLCRERRDAGRGLSGFVLGIFVETLAGIVREHVTHVMRCTMQRDSNVFLQVVKYGALAVSALMVAGILTLMVISRGTGEDITGIVAPALLITIVSSVVAVVAAVRQKRAGPNLSAR